MLFLVVADVGLFHKADFLLELFHRAVSNFVHNLGGLALFQGLLAVNFTLTLHSGLVQAGGVKSQGIGGSHLHGQIFDQGQHIGVGRARSLAAGQKDQRAILPLACR